LNHRLPLFESLEIRQLLSAGQLDPTFGNGGIVVTDQGLSNASGIMVQGDGKILMTAFGDGPSGTHLARYNADGSLDSSFGNNGVSSWALGTSGVISDSSSLDLVGGVIVAPDGRILVLSPIVITQTGGRQAISRFNADGTPDTTFGDNGKTALTWTPTTPPASGTWAMMTGSKAVHVLDNGDILIARSSGLGIGANLQVVRLTPDGQVDQTFGDNGVASADGAGIPAALAVQGDGKIVVATSQYEPFNDPRTNNYPRPQHANIVRFDADGSIDTSFGTGGRVSEAAASGGDIYSHELLIAPDGKIVLEGSESPAETGRFVIRYNTDGSRDTGFGDQGKQVLADPTLQIAIDAQGRIVTAGYRSLENSEHDELFSQRLNADGTFDTGYGDQGTMTLSLGTQSYVAQALALTADGDLLIAGSTSVVHGTNADVLLLRLQGGDGVSPGLQGSTPGATHHRRSPKRIAMELAAAASKHHHRSAKRRALELADATKSHRSPKRIAMEQANQQQAGSLFAGDESKLNQTVFGSD
jgi:uncharacterized delta-60 repeat protein